VAKLNLLLLLVLLACALGLVTSQHVARKRFAELEREQTRARELEIEYGRLQLEASTWATPARLARVAQELGLRAPEAGRVRTIEVAADGDGP